MTWGLQPSTVNPARPIPLHILHHITCHTSKMRWIHEGSSRRCLSCGWWNQASSRPPSIIETDPGGDACDNPPVVWSTWYRVQVVTPSHTITQYMVSTHGFYWECFRLKTDCELGANMDVFFIRCSWGLQLACTFVWSVSGLPRLPITQGSA